MVDQHFASILAVPIMHTKSTDVKSKKAQQGEATRRALIDAAQKLFGEKGYVATSLDEIVAGAKVTKGAFYHHYNGKQDLFAAVYEQVKLEVSDRFATAFIDCMRISRHCLRSSCRIPGMTVRRWVLCSVLPHCWSRPSLRTSVTHANSPSRDDQRSPQSSWLRLAMPYCKLTIIALRCARIGCGDSGWRSIWARIASTACGESAQLGSGRVRVAGV